MVLRLFKIFIFAIAIAASSFSPALAQSQGEAERGANYGGYGALGGGLSWSVVMPGGLALMKAIYAPEDPTICSFDPAACRPSALDHVLVGLTGAGVLGVTAAAGYGSGLLARHLELDPELGWGLAGGFLGVPTTILLYMAIPRWNPDWANQLVGILVTAGGAVGAGLLTAHIAARRGHAWPEFGFGFAGMIAGLLIGQGVAPNTAAVPLLGGFGALIGAGLSGFLWGYDASSEPDPAETMQQIAVPYQIVIPF